MSVSIVARRYAQALLELGAETGTLDRLVEDMTTIASAWETSPDLRNALENVAGVQQELTPGRGQGDAFRRADK